MKCQKCGSILPDDSKFCQVCGSRLDEQVLSEEAVEPVAPVVSPPTAWPEQESPAVFGEPPAVTPKKKRGVPAAAKVFLIILPVLLAASLVINVVQFVRGADLAETVASQETMIDRQRNEILAKEQQISKLEENSNYYEQICSAAKSGKVGYAANNFRASEGIIVVGKNQTGRKFTLTAHWSNGGTVYTNYSGGSANVSFDKNEWTTSTTMTIEPQYEGITTVTFTNSRDSNTFKVIIVVTD